MTTTVPMCADVHFEMPYKDRERAARFYAAAFEAEVTPAAPAGACTMAPKANALWTGHLPKPRNSSPVTP